MNNLIDLISEIGIEPKKVATTGGGEFHSACPKCGGIDRFFIQPYYQMKNCIGRYSCRRCGISGDAIEFCREFLGLGWQDALSKCNVYLLQPSINYFEQTQQNEIKKPPLLWMEKVTAFVELANKEIFKRPSVLRWLEKRGISNEVIKHYKIGYSENQDNKDGSFWFYCSDFGIKEESAKKIWIPKGIIIPMIEPSGSIIRIKIRRIDWKKDDKIPKYIALKGSMKGMNIIGDKTKSNMFVFESELDAYVLNYLAGTNLFTVAIGGNNKKPDIVTDYWANRKALYICHDNDEGGKVMLSKWQKLYPHAQSYPVPFGKDIGEAIQGGLDIKKWLSNIENF